MTDLLSATLPDVLLRLPGFRLYVLCVVVLMLKVLFVANFTGYMRLKVKVSPNPEDSAINLQGADAEHPAVARVQRAHRNDVENIPFFFMLGLLAVLTGVPLLGMQIVFNVFTVARVLYTVAYLRGLQPWRTLTFAAGQLSIGALMVLLLVRVL
jgi:prostaglandin-E synthase 1